MKKFVKDLWCSTQIGVWFAYDEGFNLSLTAPSCNGFSHRTDVLAMNRTECVIGLTIEKPDLWFDVHEHRVR